MVGVVGELNETSDAAEGVQAEEYLPRHLAVPAAEDTPTAVKPAAAEPAESPSQTPPPSNEEAADNAPGKSSSKRKREREGKEAEEPQNPECTCFVGGIPYAMDPAAMKTFFSQYGEVASTKVIMDIGTRKSKGFGFVQFTTKQAALDLKALKRIDVQGKMCDVGDPQRTEPRNGGGGGGGRSKMGGGMMHRGGATGMLPVKQLGGGKRGGIDSAPTESNRLFVGGLPRTAGKAEVKDFLSQFGPVQEFHLVTDGKTGASKGFGFCTYVDAADAIKFKSLQSVQFMGQTLNVGDAKYGRHGGGGGGGGGMMGGAGIMGGMMPLGVNGMGGMGAMGLMGGAAGMGGIMPNPMGNPMGSPMMNPMGSPMMMVNPGMGGMGSPMMGGPMMGGPVNPMMSPIMGGMGMAAYDPSSMAAAQQQTTMQMQQLPQQMAGVGMQPMLMQPTMPPAMMGGGQMYGQMHPQMSMQGAPMQLMPVNAMPSQQGMQMGGGYMFDPMQQIGMQQKIPPQ